MEGVWLVIGIYTVISAYAGLIIATIIDEFRNPLYELANLFICGFAGSIFGGIFGTIFPLRWDLWAILIAILFAGVVSIFTAIYVKDKLLRITSNVKNVYIAIFIILLIGMFSVLPERTVSYPETEYTSIPVYQLGEVTGMIENNYEVENIVTPTQGNYPISLDIKTYKSAMRFPTIQANPTEGQYIDIKITFSVASSSPVDWQKPLWTIYVGTDTNNDGRIDTILPDIFYKLPSQAGLIYTSAVCLYNSTNGQPMQALYNFVSGGYLNLLPVVFGVYNQVKDDSQYTFQNTPEKFKPPYDQYSWYYSPSNGTIYPFETLNSWVVLRKGETKDVYMRLYCADGMAINDTATTWTVVIDAYDLAYSSSQAIKSATMTFTVQPYQAQPPTVNITFNYWIVTILLGGIGLACIISVKKGWAWLVK